MAEVKFPHPYTIGGYVSFQFSIRSVLRAPFCASFCVFSLYQLDSMCQQKRGDSQYHRRCRRFQHPSAPCQHCRLYQYAFVYLLMVLGGNSWSNVYTYLHKCMLYDNCILKNQILNLLRMTSISIQDQNTNCQSSSNFL